MDSEKVNYFKTFSNKNKNALCKGRQRHFAETIID
jgi:hypothetical protein